MTTRIFRYLRFVASFVTTLLLVTGCEIYEDLQLREYAVLRIPNHSDTPVYMFLPDHFASYSPLASYDSTIFFSAQEIQLIPPNKSIKIERICTRDERKEELRIYMKNFPSDTVHLFIFDPEVVDNHGWNQIKDGYRVLKRYDLTSKDLMNKKLLNGLWPPTPEVAYIKQYPPYAPATQSY